MFVGFLFVFIYDTRMWPSDHFYLRPLSEEVYHSKIRRSQKHISIFSVWYYVMELAFWCRHSGDDTWASVLISLFWVSLPSSRKDATSYENQCHFCLGYWNLGKSITILFPIQYCDRERIRTKAVRISRYWWLLRRVKLLVNTFLRSRVTK